MAISDTLKPASDILSFSSKSVGIFFIVLIIVAIIGGFLYFFSLRKKQKNQWTHNLKVRRELPNGTLSKEVVHRMARFPKIKGTDVFQLEKKFMGSWLFTEIQEYSGLNEFEIIISTENMVYYKSGETFDKSNGNLKISGKHAQIDLVLKDIKDDWQKEYQEAKKISIADLIKTGITVVLIIAGLFAIKFMAGAYVEGKQSDIQVTNSLIEASENFLEVTEYQAETNLLYKEDSSLMKREFCKQDSSYSFCKTL